MRLLALRAETMQAMRRLKLPCDDITPIGLWGSDMYLIGVNNEQFEVLRLWNVQTEDITPATLRDFHTETAAVPTTPSAGNAASDARITATETPRETSSLSAPKASPVSPRSAPSAWAAVAPEPAPAPTRAQKTAARSYDAAPTPPAAVDVAPVSAPVAQAPAPEAPTRARQDAASDSVSGNGTAASVAPNGAGDTEAKPAAPKEKQESSAGKLRMTVDGEHLYAEIKGGKIVLKDRTYDSLAHARDSIRRERNKVAVWEYFDEGVKSWRPVLNRD
jgi:hypothetical protein